MGEETTNLLRSHNQKLDEICVGVMPDSWEGHARLAIRQSEIVPVGIEEKAIEKALKLSDKKDKSPKKAAADLIRALEESK